MKTMHKLLAMVLALTLVLAMATTAFAESGTIKVEGTTINRSYTLYKMFNVETVDSEEKTKYRYSETLEWKDFVHDVNGLYTVEDGYVYWGSNTVSAVDGAALAKLASQYVTKKSLTSTITVEVGGEAIPLEQGYYLMVPNDGTTCGVFIVTDGNPTVIREKTSAAGLPRVQKMVKEDSTGTFGELNHADLGEVFNFQTTIIAGDEASNYVLHDVLNSHLELVENGSIELDGTALTLGEHYTVQEGNEEKDPCSFHIVFNHEKLPHLRDGSRLTVHYSAKIVPCDDESHTSDALENKTWLTYDQDLKSNEATTNTYTYQIKIIKKDTDDNRLKDAEFALQDLFGKYYSLNAGVVSWVDNLEDATKVTTDDKGEAHFKGLDAEDYVLIETQVPGGYTGATNIEVSTKGDTNALEGSNCEVTVTNTLGNALPETGGMGTTMFYVVGGLMAAVAVVLLITKKRVSAK